jgi:UDP-GlcNAc:undecaprenyl-phosphate/decaprenyl-phosphate GlcNAc-1-phosphate transferase
MLGIVTPLVASFLVCLVLAPAIRAIAIRFSWYDMPGELKTHASPIPRLGGVALIGGLLVGTLLASTDVRPPLLWVEPLFAVWLIGLIDDLRGSPALLRLAVQLFCGAAFWFGGLRLHWSSAEALDLTATALFTALVVNSFNLLDGMDGLALTVASGAGIGFVALASGSSPSPFLWLSAAVPAISIAMFIYNRPPATIFIGDSGSTLLGALFALLCLAWVSTRPNDRSVLTPATFLLVPLADALAAIVRRVRGGHSPLLGDRRHFYDLLRLRGWSVARILLVTAAITLGLVALSLAMLGSGVDARAPLVPLALVGLLCGSLLNSFVPERRQVLNDLQIP